MQFLLPHLSYPQISISLFFFIFLTISLFPFLFPFFSSQCNISFVGQIQIKYRYHRTFPNPKQIISPQFNIVVELFMTYLLT